VLPLAALAPAEAAVAQEADTGTAASGMPSAESQSPEELRAALSSRGLAALVARQDPETGAWKGDVGFKLNWEWRVTAADVPHVGVTGLAVDALVEAGARRGEGPYGVALARGVDYLLSTQSVAGQFGAHGTRMREHAHALRALSSVMLAKHESAALAEPILRAARFSIDAQNDLGGWRFAPGDATADVIETVFQLDALNRANSALGARRAQGGPGLAAEVTEFNSKAWMPAARRATEILEQHRIVDPQHAAQGGFRYQLQDDSRVTARTTAAGLLAFAHTTSGYPDVWHATYERYVLKRAAEAEQLPPGHFCLWEADLLAVRGVELLAWHGPPAGLPLRDELRAEELRRLAALEADGGGWASGVGPGDAYFTALGCLRLARPLR
jgi:hypothetical protein